MNAKEKKLSFENSYSSWIEYMTYTIYTNYLYGKTLGISPILGYEEWCKPDMYCIDGINEKELPKRYNHESYLSHQIETFQDWYNRI